MSGKIEKYGLKWPASTHALQIEMAMIRKGGKFKVDEKEYGEGLVHHYEQMRRIIWPELDSHRWHDLIIKEIRRPNAKVTVLMGPGSSSKTHEGACNYLMEYYCFPNETCLLVSSTDLRGLELRVWGEIKSLHERAKNRFDFIPGNLIDSKHAIATDDIEEDEVRDLRRGAIGIPTVQGGRAVGLSKWLGIKQKRIRLVADECFPAGTFVDTPSGKIEIQNIKSGDFVFCASGIGRVRGVMKKSAEQLLEIKTKDGRKIICTPEHPFLTQIGWKKACELNELHYMVSQYEAMQILRGEFSTIIERYLLQEVFRDSENSKVQTLRSGVQKASTNPEIIFLQSVLRREVNNIKPGIQGEVLYQGANQEDSGFEKENLHRESRAIHCHAGKAAGGYDSLHELTHTGTEISTQEEDEPHHEGFGNEASDSWWKRHRANPSGKDFTGGVFPLCEKQLRGKDRTEGGKRLSTALQGGCGISRNNAGSGGRWKLTSNARPQGAGRKKNQLTHGSWVDSVTVHQQADSGGLSERERGVEVYNLEVEGHPSYSIEGLLVHNCQFMGGSFLSAFANLDKNEDFQAICLGNPVDFNDPLGKAAEPKDGWKSHTEPTKTECWDTRFMNGRCVNLIGTDSPNFDFPENEPTRYKYLISREKIANTLSFFPENSLEYYSQCIGSMKVAGMERRVLTRDTIRQYEADKDCSFLGETVSIFFVDAAYGGDNCVAGDAKFGKDINGRMVLRFGEPHIVPIIVGSGADPEYQIANYVKQHCTILNVSPENMGHDATGRGSLGTALAVVWSNQTIPVESGGSATNRPVSNDLYIYDDSTTPPTKRLKLGHEHYDKRVTEFWFSLRYAVESGQIRNLPEEAIEDLVERKWDYSRGNKICVEPKSGRVMADGSRKPGMKERIGRSPDFGDWACGILEIARRRGFLIEKLGRMEKNKVENGLQKLHLKHQKFLQSRQLQNA